MKSYYSLEYEEYTILLLKHKNRTADTLNIDIAISTDHEYSSVVAGGWPVDQLRSMGWISNLAIWPSCGCPLLALN
jgi:hypothetical protein